MSNAQSWAETFAPIEAHNREVVFRATWGHLAPIKHKKYKCSVLFSVTAYRSGTREIIDDCFSNDLSASPWLYDALNELIHSFDLEDAGVYRFDGFFRNYNWTGIVKLVYALSPDSTPVIDNNSNQ